MEFQTQTPMPAVPPSNASYVKRLERVRDIANSGELAFRVKALTHAADTVTGVNSYSRILKRYIDALKGEVQAEIDRLAAEQKAAKKAAKAAPAKADVPADALAAKRAKAAADRKRQRAEKKAREAAAGKEG